MKDGKTKDDQALRMLRTALQEVITRGEINQHRLIKRIGKDLNGALNVVTQQMDGFVREATLAIRASELLSMLEVGGIDHGREYIDELRTWVTRWRPERSTNPYRTLFSLEEFEGITELIASFDRRVPRRQTSVEARTDDARNRSRPRTARARTR